jgi:hypothetical protein
MRDNASIGAAGVDRVLESGLSQLLALGVIQPSVSVEKQQTTLGDHHA